MLTAAEEWKLEGERKGKIEGKIETIENLLRLGIDWSIIEQATGMDRLRFQHFKQQIKLTQATNKSSPPQQTIDNADQQRQSEESASEDADSSHIQR